MTPVTAVAATPVVGSGEGVRRLRSFLDGCGFDAGGVRGLLRAGDELVSDPFELAVQLRRLAEEPSPLASLVELFVLGSPVPRRRAEADFAPLGLDLLEQLGLVTVADEVHPLVRIVPHDELLIASDPPRERRGTTWRACIGRRRRLRT